MARRMTFKVLYDPVRSLHGDANIDLVLVHGIDGDPIATWQDKTSNKVWPRDLLCKTQPSTRVLSFGYNADMFRNNSMSTIRDNAKSLLACLDLERRQVNRPIVFAAHCLGGLIVKQALCIAEHDDEFGNIFDATGGIIFFGTPHQGTDRSKDEWHRIAANFSLLDQVSRGKRSPLVDAMLSGSDDLANINDKFRQLPTKFQITSFYETGMWPGTNTIIVDKTAGQMLIGGEYSRQIPVDHSAICTFPDADDIHFRMVVDAIEKSAENAFREEEQWEPEPSMVFVGQETDDGFCWAELDIATHKQNTIASTGNNLKALPAPEVRGQDSFFETADSDAGEKSKKNGGKRFKWPWQRFTKSTAKEYR